MSSGTRTRLDRDARKQVLLTRIAFERADLRSELGQVNQAMRLPNLLRLAVGGGLIKSLLGSTAPAAGTGWLGTAWQLVTRYRVAATLLGSAAPILRRQGWGRLAALGAAGAALWFGWRRLQSRKPTPV
jgi:hypothetical protein